ncbi:hypothetical protein P154DRAFT_101084 [Amniculicola lignicola CBS 123094]|uniref:Uncharacterized protein n=1 Tax=Amniculicola lignicola CBS 123094 TaxID=1392246 RepID=A0A6A5WQR6_9PLEO|nr:hypothetical protein P154DRAFT_101084 [Amniculicola lignicola CBS 123094]
MLTKLARIHTKRCHMFSDPLGKLTLHYSNWPIKFTKFVITPATPHHPEGLIYEIRLSPVAHLSPHVRGAELSSSPFPHPHVRKRNIQIPSTKVDSAHGAPGALASAKIRHRLTFSRPGSPGTTTQPVTSFQSSLNGRVAQHAQPLLQPSSAQPDSTYTAEASSHRSSLCHPPYEVRPNRLTPAS